MPAAAAETEVEPLSDPSPEDVISVEEADEEIAKEQAEEEDEEEETQEPGRPLGKQTGRREGKFTDYFQEVKCPICGRPAEADLAVNPGTEGGPGAAAFPRAKGLARPITPVLSSGPWYLVVCEDPAHRTLWHSSRLEPIGGEAAGGGGKGGGKGGKAQKKEEKKDKDKEEKKPGTGPGPTHPPAPAHPGGPAPAQPATPRK